MSNVKFDAKNLKDAKSEKTENVSDKVNVKETKISEEEMDGINKLREDQNNKVLDLGKLELEVERRKAEIIIEIQNISKKYLDKMNDIKKAHKISKEAVITKFDGPNLKITYVESKRK